MGNNQNVIELNGKRYDALTGRLIAEAASDNNAHHTKKNSSRTAKTHVDGITAPRRSSRSPHNSEHGHTTQNVKRHARKLAGNAHNIHRGKTKAERSKTLMRNAVKKPETHPSTTHQPKTHDRAPEQEVDTKPPIINHQRANRAQNILKSNQISRFGESRPQVNKHVKPLEVKPAPDIDSVAATLDQPNGNNDVSQSDPLDSITRFDLAIEQSTAHLNPKHKKPPLRNRVAYKLRVSPKVLSIAAGVFVTLFVGGLIMYRNLPQLAMKLASTRAGVNASLPSYKPSGYDLAGPVQYTSGTVTVSYKSVTNDNGYQVVQKSSDWTSQSLLENFVSAKEPYQTFQDKGRTIYIYEDTSATWVSGGVWYQIEGDSDLTSDQLLRIVSSL